MLEKMLVLLERFVVAHELIAANSAKPVAVASEVAAAPEAVVPEGVAGDTGVVGVGAAPGTDVNVTSVLSALTARISS